LPLWSVIAAKLTVAESRMTLSRSLAVAAAASPAAAAAAAAAARITFCT